MSTPNVTVDIADFLTNPQPANKVGYPVSLEPVPFVAPDVRQAITNSSGQATLSAVVPGDYDLKILGLGIETRRVTVTNVAGPLVASDLDEADTGSRVPSAGNPLVAGDNITLKDTAAGLEISASGGGGGSGLPDGILTTDDGGLLFMSEAAEEEYGPDNTDIIASFREHDVDSIGGIKIYGEIVNSIEDYDEGGSFTISVFHDNVSTNSAGTFSLGTYDTNGSTSFSVLSKPNSLNITGDISGTSVISFSPSAPNSDGSVAYVLDTSVDLTNAGAKILSVLTNATERFAVYGSGRIKTASSPPANAGASGVAGQVTWDAGFIYVCTATDTWKRVAIETW